MDKIVLIGGGGHAISVLDTLLSCDGYQVIGIVDSIFEGEKTLLGIPYLGDDSILQEIYNSGVNNAVIAVGSIGDTGLRVKLYDMAKKIGFNLPVIIDKTAIVGIECAISEGVFIGKGVVVNAFSTIGRMAIINSTALVEHECKIGAFSHIAPGCKLGGKVLVGEHTHIGIGSTVIQGVQIGDNSLIGAGSVVVKNIPNGIKAYGNPCREVENK